MSAPPITSGQPKLDAVSSAPESDGESAAGHRRFYDEYLSVMDLSADFYLDTIRHVFQEHSLPEGTFTHRGEKVEPAAIKKTALMTIEGGERFGLAQLHQLRGRISRGAHPGYLCVFAGAATDEAQERLDAFTKTSDGFELAEIDFGLRGPGDLFGTRQHGLPPLRIADLSRDADVVEEARADAQALIESDADLSNAAFARLRRMVFHRYGEALDLGDVG